MSKEALNAENFGVCLVSVSELTNFDPAANPEGENRAPIVLNPISGTLPAKGSIIPRQNAIDQGLEPYIGGAVTVHCQSVPRRKGMEDPQIFRFFPMPQVTPGFTELQKAPGGEFRKVIPTEEIEMNTGSGGGGNPTNKPRNSGKDETAQPASSEQEEEVGAG